MKKTKGIALRTRLLAWLLAALLLCASPLTALADNQPDTDAQQLTSSSDSATTTGETADSQETVEDSERFMAQVLAGKEVVYGKDTLTLLPREAKADGTLTYASGLYDDACEALLLSETIGNVTWNFTLETAGWYVLRMKYTFPNATGVTAMHSVFIDNKLPYKEADNIAFTRLYHDVGEVLVNNIGDEVRNSVEEISAWQTTQLYDANGYYSTPLLFPMEAGAHSITLSYGTQDMYIASLVIEPYQTLPTYEEVKATYPAGMKVDYLETYQAEDTMIVKNDSTVRIESDSDPSTEPISYGYRVFNTTGGYRWRKGNQSVTHQFKVPADGYYRVALRVKQSWNDGLPSYRTVSIDGKVPFDELREVRFDYSTDWQTVVLGNGEEDYLFYLTAGEHTLTLNVTMAKITDIVQNMYDNMTLMSDMLLDITKLCGNEPDPNYDYQFFKNIPTLEHDMGVLVEDMQKQYDLIYAISGKDTSMGSNLISNIKQLQGMLKDPYSIARRYANLTQVQESLGSWYLSMQSMPLLMDEFTIAGSETEVPVRKATFWQKLRSTVKSFTISFVRDYDAVGSMMNENTPVKETIDVWVGFGNEWAEIMKEIADEKFTPETGIALNMNVLAASQLGSGSINSLMLSIISDKAPDVVISSSAQVVSMSVRDAVVDLSKMPDFDVVKKRYLEQAFVGYTHAGGVWGMPENMNFNCLFYRTDVLAEYGIEVPDTREEMYNETLPKLFQNGLSYMAPTNMIQYVYQHGGDFYTADGHYSALDTEVAFKAFREYTEVYTHYSAPVAANFFTRFRNGEMPIGYGDYATYIQFMSAAPEITGKWAIAPLPGIKKENGVVDRSWGGITSGTNLMVAQRTEPKYEESWEFLKWWSSTEVQLEFAKEIESMMGISSRWNTANVEAFMALGWSKDDLEVINEQWNWAKATRAVLGSNTADRYVSNAFTNVVVLGEKSVRDALEEAVKEINRELKSKQEEYGIFDKVV